jgi:hypothetical protein
VPHAPAAPTVDPENVTVWLVAMLLRATPFDPKEQLGDATLTE